MLDIHYLNKYKCNCKNPPGAQSCDPDGEAAQMCLVYCVIAVSIIQKQYFLIQKGQKSTLIDTF